MTTYTLWSQAAETVTGTGATAGGTIGLHFTVSTGCTLNGLWLYSPSGNSLTALPTVIALYNYTTNALIHSETVSSWSGAAGSGWVFASFSSPPSVSSGTDYMAAAYHAAGPAWFIYNDAYTWPASNGALTAPDDVGSGQGWYSTTAGALSFPSSQLPAWNWWLDVQVTTLSSITSSGSVSMSTITATGGEFGATGTVSLGTMTATGGGIASSGSVSLSSMAAVATGINAGLVQETSGSTTSTTLTLVFPANVTVNSNIIVAVCGYHGGSLSNIVYSGGSGTFIEVSSTSTVNATVWIYQSVPGSGNTVTITTTVGGIIAWAYEVGGAVTWDTSGVNSATGTSWSSGASGTTVYGGHFVVGLGHIANSSGSITPSASGWVNETAYTGLTSGGVAVGGVSGYQMSSTQTTFTYSGTTSVSTTYGAIAAAFLCVPQAGWYWGGMLFNEHSGVGYTGITCTFNIPSSVPLDTSSNLCSVWVGLGNVYQCGIFLASTSGFTGNVNTNPWSWWLPGAGEFWDPVTFPTAAGDSLTLTLTHDTQFWYATIANNTRSWSYTEIKSVLGLNLNSWTTNSSGLQVSPQWVYPTSSAEIIIEQEGQTTHLPDYGSITFTNISTTPAVKQNPLPLYPVWTMTDGMNEYPGAYSISSGQFTLHWNKVV